MAGRLDGKVVIITGGGSGIGLAAARRFCAEGAELVLAGRSETVDIAARELSAISVRADVSQQQDVQRLVAAAIDRHGAIDVLCNVAGADPIAMPFADEVDSVFERMIRVNLQGVYLTMKAAIPHMLARGSGSIVNVASSASLIGTPNLASYSAAKAGVLGLTRSVALEYAARSIRVNTVCPGAIQTPMLDRGVSSNPAAADYLINMIPMGRIGRAEEVAAAMLFLASDESSYVTGISLPVEGGQTAG